jgi:hypothetical protein
MGQILGALVVVGGILRFVYDKRVGCLLIALAICIAGPIEDMLTAYVQKEGKDDDERRALGHFVDLSTSIGFLICLGLAVWSM